MLLSDVRYALTVLIFCPLVFACNDSGGSSSRPVVVFDNFDGGTDGTGCSQPLFPGEQPQLSIFPRPQFLLSNTASQNNTSGQAQVDPGELIEAEITVNAATEQLRIELADVWNSRRVVYQEDMQLSGSAETLELAIFPPSATPRGRYFMRLTLCNDDCRDLQVVYDVVQCEGTSTENCAHNEPYERTLFEDGEIIQVDPTCIELDSRPNQGSGTVVIQ